MTTLALENLAEGASRFGLRLDSRQLGKFDIFASLLQEGNRRANLIGQADVERILERHLLDSLSCVVSGSLAGAAKVIDVGSGAGLPGIPLAIAVPSLRMTLLDSSAKRTAFLRAAVEKLDLTNIEIIAARAEDAARLTSYRDSFDIAVARAVAPLPALVEYALPFLKIGGVLVAQRGPAATEEAGNAAAAIRELKGTLREVIAVEVPYLNAARRLVIIAKTGPTPDRYPRRSGVPRKRPIKTD
ncbi:MAG: 16S rRNA (guanine(527)-N(7))-methyltransferase RsmG [Actinomycetota bacterium]